MKPRWAYSTRPLHSETVDPRDTSSHPELEITHTRCPLFLLTTFLHYHQFWPTAKRATPRPDAQIGSPHTQLDLLSCAPASASPGRILTLPVPTGSLSWTDSPGGRYAPAQCSPGDAMIGARRQIELRHRRPHQTLTLRQAQCTAFCLQLAELPDLPDAHIGVTHHGLQSRETLRRSRETSDSETPTLNITRPRIDSEDSPTLSPLSFHNP